MKRAPEQSDVWWTELDLSFGQYEYEYLLINGSRLSDPFTRRLSNGKTRVEIGAGGVSTADDYNWQSNDYIRPSLDTLVIYELHVDDFAAQVASLDLIVSTSNTAVHMAGALGKPVWTLLHDVPDWRWQLDRSDALWYSSMTLFRQSVSGDWESVFEQVQSALKRFVEEKLNKNPKENFSY